MFLFAKEFCVKLHWNRLIWQFCCYLETRIITAFIYSDLRPVSVLCVLYNPTLCLYLSLSHCLFLSLPAVPYPACLCRGSCESGEGAWSGGCPESAAPAAPLRNQSCCSHCCKSTWCHELPRERGDTVVSRCTDHQPSLAPHPAQTHTFTQSDLSCLTGTCLY